MKIGFLYCIQDFQKATRRKDPCVSKGSTNFLKMNKVSGHKIIRVALLCTGKIDIIRRVHYDQLYDRWIMDYLGICFYEGEQNSKLLLLKPGTYARVLKDTSPFAKDRRRNK